MRAKLGLLTPQAEDNAILSELLALMSNEHSDYTFTFRQLSYTGQQETRSPLRDEFIDRDAFDSWYSGYQKRLLQDEASDSERQAVMQAANPAIVLRNYLAQQVIEEVERGETAALQELHLALQHPFDEAASSAALRQRPPEWSKTLEVSCSS